MKFAFDCNCGYASCNTSKRPIVPPKLLAASITACFCSGDLSPASPCGDWLVAFNKRERACAIVPNTSCSWIPASFADSTRLFIRSARRCSCVSILAHLPFTFSRFVVSVLYPQPLAANEIIATAKRISNLRVFISKSPIIKLQPFNSGLLRTRTMLPFKLVYCLNNLLNLEQVGSEKIIGLFFRRGEIAASAKRKNSLKGRGVKFEESRSRADTVGFCHGRFLAVQQQHGPEQRREARQTVAHQVAQL